MTLNERYEEIMALLPPDVDLIEELDEAPMETYIMEAARRLGFRHPGVFLDLGTPLTTLRELYGG